MNTPDDIFLSEQVNLAHMFSLAGMIRKYLGDRQADVFASQLFKQTTHLMTNEEAQNATYETLRGIDFKFYMPISAVVDISEMLMSVGKKAEKGTDVHSATLVLAAQLRPFAMSGMIEIDKLEAKQTSHQTPDEFPPNSHN